MHKHLTAACACLLTVQLEDARVLLGPREKLHSSVPTCPITVLKGEGFFSMHCSAGSANLNIWGMNFELCWDKLKKMVVPKAGSGACLPVRNQQQSQIQAEFPSSSHFDRSLIS